MALAVAADAIPCHLNLERETFSFPPPPSSSDSCPCEGTHCSAGHSRRAGGLCCRRRAQHRTQTQLLPTSMCRRPLHSVVQAHLSMPDMRSSVFCSYSSHSNGCIGGMATTRRGGYGSGSQCWHFIEGGQEGDWTSGGGLSTQIETRRSCNSYQ